MNHREKKRKLIITTLSIICIAELSLTIAYAALSETLTISGSGTVKASTWKLALQKYSQTIKGTATVTSPVVEGTTVSYNATFTKPGDSITLYYYIYNQGTLNAELASIVNSTPTCTSSTGNTADEELICNNLNISILTTTDTKIEEGVVVNQDHYICEKNSTSSYEQATIKIQISLDSSMTAVPSSTVTISNIKHELIFKQTDKICTTSYACFVAGTKVLTENGYKDIENITTDDYVYALNEETNEYELKKVLQKFNNRTKKIYEISVANHTIKTTDKHEFYVIDKGWIKAFELKIGDKLSTKENIDPTIKAIEIIDYDEYIPVYNMEVEGHHNYLITEDNLLVHNAESPAAHGE